MHSKSAFPSHHEAAENPQAYCPVAYNGVQQSRSSRSPRNSISTLSSDSSSTLSLTDSKTESCQNSTGNHETKRSFKNGFLKPAQTAQFDFLVEKFKHRKEASKEGLTAANLKAFE